MLKVGEFAQLAGVSVRVLRHYDQLGLLRPRYVDQSTGYRYYSPEQLTRLHRILALKDLGLTLEQVAYLLDEAVTAQEIRGILLLKRAELHQRVQEEQARLARVESRLQTLEQETEAPECEVVLKSIEPLDVVLMRRALPPGHSPAALFCEGYALLREVGVKPDTFLCLYYGRYLLQQYPMLKPRRFLVEAAFHVDATLLVLPDRRFRITALTGFPLVASTVYCGPDHTRHLAFQDIYRWMERNSYRLAAPAREIYLKRDPMQNHITEVQLPLEKVDVVLSEK